MNTAVVTLDAPELAESEADAIAKAVRVEVVE